MFARGCVNVNLCVQKSFTDTGFLKATQNDISFNIMLSTYTYVSSYSDLSTSGSQ